MTFTNNAQNEIHQELLVQKLTDAQLGIQEVQRGMMSQEEERKSN